MESILSGVETRILLPLTVAVRFFYCTFALYSMRVWMWVVGEGGGGGVRELSQRLK